MTSNTAIGSPNSSSSYEARKQRSLRSAPSKPPVRQSAPAAASSRSSERSSVHLTTKSRYLSVYRADNRVRPVLSFSFLKAVLLFPAASRVSTPVRKCLYKVCSYRRACIQSEITQISDCIINTPRFRYIANLGVYQYQKWRFIPETFMEPSAKSSGKSPDSSTDDGVAIKM